MFERRRMLLCSRAAACCYVPGSLVVARCYVPSVVGGWPSAASGGRLVAAVQDTHYAYLLYLLYLLTLFTYLLYLPEAKQCFQLKQVR